MRYAALLAFAGLVAGCSSDPAATPGNEGGGGSGGSGGAGGEAQECACAAHEICAAGTCIPETTFTAGMLQTEDIGYAWLRTQRYLPGSDDPNATVVDGMCSITSEPPAVSEFMTLDLGAAELHVNGTPAGSFPALQEGETSLGQDGSVPLSPSGLDVITVTWSGGADHAAGRVALTMPQGLTITSVDPWVPGDPWTIAWTGPSDVDITLATPMEEIVFCQVEDGTSLTMPGSVTAALEIAPTALTLRSPSTVQPPSPDGITVLGLPLQLVSFDVPATP